VFFAPLLAAALLLPAQQPLRSTDDERPDSARVRRAAEEAQAAFERERRRYLPVFRGGRPSPCEERIGRFCYWYDGTGPLPEEPPRSIQARARLLQRLEKARVELPGDGWIAGQVVRYLLEHGQADTAVARAGACGSDLIWCKSLLGFALHAAGRFDQAERAFDQAITRMPAEDAKAWQDLDPVLEDEMPRERADSLLWLGDPLFSRPGNDLRTELLARRVMIRLLEEAGRTDRLSWGPDAAEMLYRYGWPIRWSVDIPHLAGYEQGSIVGHERQPAYGFFPVGREMRWDPSRRRPRARYAPAYARAFTATGEHQVALFRRGDSTIAVAAFDLRRDTLFGDAPVSAALALVRDPGTEPVVGATEHPGARGVIVAAAPWQPGAVSLEIERMGEGRFAVARTLVRRAEPGMALSDILFFEPGQFPPGTLAEAALTARSDLRLASRRPVGLYWEVYGVTGDTIRVSIAVVPGRPGFLGRMGRTLGVVGTPPPITLEWAGPSGGGGEFLGRAIELDLSRLAKGRYEIVVEAEDRSGRRASARRPVVIVN
jgi:tetratricopeptide (TPR) repeat protein